MSFLVPLCLIAADADALREELKAEKTAAAALEAVGAKVVKEGNRVVGVHYEFLKKPDLRRVRDDLLDPLRHLKRLRKLKLSGNFSSVGLSNIKGLTSLEKLELDGWYGMDDATMACLAGLVNLVELRIHGGPHHTITAAGMVHLKKMTKLEKLELRDIKGTGFDFSTLTTLKSLQVARLAISDKDMEGLARLTDLEVLDLSDTLITDEGMKHLAGLKKLHTLLIHNVRVTDAGMKSLHGLSKLREVEAYGTKVTEDGVRALVKDVPKVYAYIHAPGR